MEDQIEEHRKKVREQKEKEREEKKEIYKLAKKLEFRKNNKEHRAHRIFTEDSVIINPSKDCSEKQLFVDNGFKNPLGNLFEFLKKGDRIIHQKDI